MHKQVNFIIYDDRPDLTIYILVMGNMLVNIINDFGEVKYSDVSMLLFNIIYYCLLMFKLM